MADQNLIIFRSSEEMRNFKLLQELEKNPTISQRELSHKSGMALGLTNASLKRMVSKDWVRIQGANSRGRRYDLTQTGLAEKARLSLHLISSRVRQYSELKRILTARLSEMQNGGLQRIVFYGVSEEMEVAYITLQEVNLKLLGILEDDEKVRSQIILGYELEPVSRVRELEPDGILITSLEEIKSRKERLSSLIDLDAVWVKDICSS